MMSISMQPSMTNPLIKSFNWTYSEFPESMYLPSIEHTDLYMKEILLGHRRAAESRVVIGGLARDIAEVLPYTIARLERLAELFSSCTFVVLTNNNSDETPTILQRWSENNPNVKIAEIDYKRKKHGQTRKLSRMIDMAYYRNELKSLMAEYPSDYSIVMDLDIIGGFSYRGVMHSFGQDWSRINFIGANSLIYKDSRRQYYDSWAYREVNAREEHDCEYANTLRFDRGEPLVKVASCFGGLGIYKTEEYNRFKYGPAILKQVVCEHVALHNDMIVQGLDNIYLNPSMLTLFSKHRAF